MGTRRKRPAGGGPLVVPTTSSLALSLITCCVMFCSFLIANTTTRSDNVESLQSSPENAPAKSRPGV